VAIVTGLCFPFDRRFLHMLPQILSTTFVVNVLPLDVPLHAILNWFIRMELKVAALADTNSDGG
jgi:hypothetical protein